jgi:arylsulfatase A-like enzyme
LGSGVFGHDRGFETFRLYRERGTRRRSVYLRSDAVLRRIERWLRRDAREPFFLYVHVTDPHFPYVPRPRHLRAVRDVAPTDEAIEHCLTAVRPYHNGSEQWGTRPIQVPTDLKEDLSALYDGEVRAADESFGRLVDLLRERRLFDRSIIVFTSDHGEEFFEHGGVGHGQTLQDEVMNVPLIMRLPGARRGGERIDALAQHVDIVPTLLDALALPVPVVLDGRSLLQGVDDGHEGWLTLSLGPFNSSALATRGWMVVGDPRLDLADARLVPNRGASWAPRTRTWMVGYGRNRLAALHDQVRHGPPIGPERVERLRALGYVLD